MLGRADKGALESTDYSVRFFPEHFAESVELPEEVGVALVMPALRADRSDALVRRLKNASGTTILPVIELKTTRNGHHNGNGNGHHIHVPWPCSVEELKRNIEAILFKGSQTAD
jgi:hypothetical protein